MASFVCGMNPFVLDQQPGKASGLGVGREHDLGFRGMAHFQRDETFRGLDGVPRHELRALSGHLSPWRSESVQLKCLFHFRAFLLKLFLIFPVLPYRR